jgi:hypothetical protein
VSRGPATAGLEDRLGFTITVPRSWYELELEPARRDQAIRELVEERLRGNDTMWEQRHAVHRLLVQQATDAWESGATYCAGFSLPTDQGPVTGSLTVSLVEDPFADGVAVSPGERFREVPRGTDPLAPYARTTAVDLPGGGECVRSSGIEDTPFPGGGLLRTVFMLTSVPLREHGRVFLVACSSPVLALADELLDLFDAVTGTFTVVRIDDEPEGVTR